MKNKFIIFLTINVVFLFLLVLFSSFKVTSNEPIMYVDLQKIIQQVPQYNQLELEYKNDYLKIIKELKQKQTSIASTNSQQNFEQLQIQAANQLHSKYMNKFEQLQENIKVYIAQYAKSHGITIVLNSNAIIYGDDLINITNDIIRYIINSQK